MFNFASPEIIVIGILIIIFFGGKKIPEFVRGLGQSVREFKKGIKEDDKK